MDSGVYVLWGSSGECLYVGSSIRMRQRVRCHYRRLVHSRADFHEFPIEELRDREEEFIGNLHPQMNGSSAVSRPGHPARKPTDVLLSFAFSSEDIKALEKIKAKMAETQGKVSNIAAIRMAIRVACKL